MFVEDGFKILQTEKESSSVIKHFSSEIKVERIPVEKIVPNPYQPRVRILKKMPLMTLQLPLLNMVFCSRCL